MTRVPDIQLQTSCVGLCRDMRFGRDDYLLSPQWYHDDFPHLAAIPRQPEDGESSPYACMWWTPLAEDFTLVDNRDDNRQPGFVHKRREPELLRLKTELCAEAIRVLDSLPGDGLPGEDLSLAAAFTVVRHAWFILADNAAAFDEKRLELVEFQRAWLELRGMLDYRAWMAASHRNLTQLAPVTPKDCVGCFTESLPVAMNLFDMGIPTWLVREKTSVLRGNIYVKYATSSTTPPDRQSPPVCIERDASFPIIYTSTPRDGKHYLAQHRFSRIRSIACARSGAGQPVYTSIDRDQMRRRDAGTILVELQTMRLQAPATEASASPASSSSSLPPVPSSSASRTRNPGPRKFFYPSHNLDTFLTTYR